MAKKKTSSDEKDFRDFLEDNFPAGSYYSVNILVQKDNFDEFLDHMQNAQMNLAILPEIECDDPTHQIEHDPNIAPPSNHDAPPPVPKSPLEKWEDENDDDKNGKKPTFH